MEMNNSIGPNGQAVVTIKKLICCCITWMKIFQLNLTDKFSSPPTKGSLFKMMFS